MKKMNKKGFTIVELVIVIAVIAILAAVMIPTFSGIVDKANRSAALQEAKNTLTQYVVDNAEKEVASDFIIKSDKYFFVVNDGSFTKSDKGVVFYDTYDAAKGASTVDANKYEWPASAADGINVPTLKAQTPTGGTTGGTDATE